MGRGEGPQRLGSFLQLCPVSAEPMEIGRIDQDAGQAVGVRELMGQGEGLSTALLGLVWITEKPQRHRQRPKTAQPWVSFVQQVLGVVLLWIVNGEPLLQMRPRRGELS